MKDLSRYFFISEPIHEFLNKEENRLLKESTQKKTYEKGEDIFLEGNYPKGVFILDKGKVKLYQKTFSGSEQIMNIHVQGEIFGYRPLLCNERYPVSASALEECSVSFIPRKEFMSVLSGSVALSNALLKFLSYEFTVWVNMVSSLTQRTVKERLLLHLLILAEKYKTKKKWPVEIALPRTDLAALIGTSSETLARMTRALKDEKIISTHGRTLIIHGPAQVDKIRKALLVI